MFGRYRIPLNYKIRDNLRVRLGLDISCCSIMMSRLKLSTIFSTNLLNAYKCFVMMTIRICVSNFVSKNNKMEGELIIILMPFGKLK